MATPSGPAWEKHKAAFDKTDAGKLVKKGSTKFNASRFTGKKKVRKISGDDDSNYGKANPSGDEYKKYMGGAGRYA